MCVSLSDVVPPSTLQQSDWHYHVASCSALCVLQRKEDPDTQCGFFRQVVDHNQRTYYVLALPRDAQGRKLKTQRSRNGRIKSRAAYYRIVRPAAGFSSDDMSSDSKFKGS